MPIYFENTLISTLDIIIEADPSEIRHYLMTSLVRLILIYSDTHIYDYASIPNFS